ncbi:hypothetical protein B0H10DRAFT_2220379 [Mycena sp. CBHHK59/15]|nr:hypothetical protein B0H10DRAFT_2220379 [Mycena sp. CBHHK59/15]
MLDLSPRYVWKSGGDIESVQRRLNRVNIIFTAEVSTSEPIFDKIDAAWENHCLIHKIDYAPAPISLFPLNNDTPNTKAWMLTGPKGHAGSRTWVEDPKLLTRYTFTLQALQQLPFSYTPNNLGEGPFIFVVPRFWNLHAPITSLFEPIHPLGVSPHLWSFMHTINKQHRLSDAYIVSDSDDDGDVHFPEAEALIAEMVRDGLPPLSNAPSVPIDMGGHMTEVSSSTIVTKSVRRQQWQEEAAAAAIPISTTTPFIAGPLLTAAMEQAATSIKPRSFLGAEAPLDLTLQNMPGAGSYSFAARQDHLLMPCEAAMDDHVIISASSIDEGARTLIILCLWLFAGRPTGLKLKELLQEQFPSPVRQLKAPPETAWLSLPSVFKSGLGSAEVPATSYMTLGMVNIEHHPDFLALADGFNIIVEPFGAQDRSHHILEWFETPCCELMLVAYDCYIKTPADIIAHLEFAETNPEHNSWGENEEMVALINTFIAHYLTEAGHPADPDQVLHVLIADGGDSTDPLLHSNLFLSVLTGSTLLPVRPTWKIKCLVTHDWSEEYPCADADGNDDYSPDIAISFRSCFKTFAITNNARLHQLLGSEDPVPGLDMEFGRWIHGQLLSSRYSFTML